jgi:hypothetical protein
VGRSRRSVLSLGVVSTLHFKMSRNTRRRGIGGAVGVLGLYFLLIIIQGPSPYDSPLRESVHRIVFAVAGPVLWMGGLLGVRGDAGMAFIAPVFASIFLYLAGLGFLAGAALATVRRRL